MARALRSAPDDDLGLPWEELADGRVRRLKRGRDFQVDTRALERAAEVAASRLGKVACVAAETIPRVRRLDEYAWVQFVDHEVLVGNPCPCGSRELVRTHPKYAICNACGARLSLSPPPQQEKFAGDGSPASLSGPKPMSEAERAKAIARGSFRSKYDERYALEQYTEILFVASDRKPRRERLYGHAVDPSGMPVLIWVQYPLSEGARMPNADSQSGEVCRVHRWPIPPFSSFIDIDRVSEPGLDQVDGRESFGSAHHPEDRTGRARLDAFSSVSLVYQEDLPGRERFYGHALDEEGAPCLIYVDYPLLSGARVKDPEDPEAVLHVVYRWPVAAFGAIIDLSSPSG